MVSLWQETVEAWTFQGLFYFAHEQNAHYIHAGTHHAHSSQRATIEDVPHPGHGASPCSRNNNSLRNTNPRHAARNPTKLATFRVP